MASLMRIAPLSARGTARISSICIPSCSSSPSTSKVRMMHASPALDPTDHVPAPTMANVEAEAQSGLSGTSNDALVHVKLNYLHPSTKDPMLIPRAGDIKTGRIRAEPHYVPLSKYVFSTMPRRDVLHSAVVYYLDGLRAGTASTKTRGEVAFSGKKILPQKGTGKARRGTRGSPLLRKGGVAHGPKPRDFSTKLNRRVRELALRSALSLRWMQGDLHVVKNLYWQPPPQSCGPLAKLLKAKGWDDALFLTAPREPQPSGVLGKTGKFSAADPIYSEEQEQEHCKEVQDFAIACANIPRTEIVNLADLTLEAHEKAKKKEDKKKPGELHAYEVLARKKLICDLGAIEWLEEKLGGSLFHEGGLERFAVEELQLDNVAEGAEVDTLAEELSESVNLEETAEDVEVRIAEDEAIEKETERVLKDFPGIKDEQTKSH